MSQNEEVDPLYSDAVQVGCSPFTVSLTFQITVAGQRGMLPPRTVADVRMSPEHAKVFSIVLRRHLKGFEQELGREIPIHPHVMQTLGLSPTEDW